MINRIGNKTCLKIVGIVLITLLSNACEYEQREKSELPELPDVVSFSMDVLPVFEANCSTTDCHDGTKSPDLTADYAFSYLSGGNYLNLETPEESSFYLKISGNSSMASYADDSDRALILKWIEQGAEEN